MDISEPTDYRWTEESLECLYLISKKINSSKMNKYLSNIINHYISKHNISSDSSVHLPKDKKLEGGIKILAIICQHYLKQRKTKNKTITARMVYKSFGYICHEIIVAKLKYSVWTLDYTELYMTDMVGKVMNYNNENAILSAYYLSRFLTYSLQIDPSIVKSMETMWVRCEDLDISLFTTQQIRELMTILKTKRRLYLRMFLVITEYLMREKYEMSEKWIKHKISVGNYQDFEKIFSDPVLEVVICLTGSLVG